MNTAVATADIISAVFLMILLFGMRISNKQNRKISTQLFERILLIAILGGWCDAASYLAEGVVQNTALLFCVNFLSYLICGVLMTIFPLYIVSVISENAKISYRAAIPALVIEGIHLLLVFVGAALGKTFAIVDYAYVVGPWDAVVNLLSLLSMAYLCLLLWRYKKFLDQQQFWALCSYFVFPMLLAVLQFFLLDFDFTYPGLSASCLMIYVEIQHVTIMEADIREKILSEASMVDPLTGLSNRRAYNEALKKETLDGGLGIGFFDLNRLKYTNDNFGHAAGDQLLIRFSQMLTTAFPEGDVYRISGDEFMVFLEGMTRDDVEQRMKAFRQEVDLADQIASFGYVYEDEANKLHMIRAAEQEMYKDKSAYYREFGIDRRGSNYEKDIRQEAAAV